MKDQRINSEIDAENHLLGCVIDNPDSIVEIITDVKAKWFAGEKQKAVWKAIVELFKRNEPITVSQIDNIAKLKDKEWLIKLWEWGNWTRDDLKFYANDLEKRYIIRKLRATSQNIIYSTDKDDINLPEYLSELAESIIQLGISDELKFYTLKDSYDRATHLTKEAANGNYVGVKSGFPDIDKIICGFYPGELVVLAGLTSVGKTAFALNIAEHNSIDNDTPILFVSLEMNDVALVRRLVCSKSNILKTYDLKSGSLTKPQKRDWEQKGQIVSDGKMYIVEKNNMDVLSLSAVVKMAILKYKIKAVFVDYLQIMSGGKKFQSDTSEVSFVSRSLKKIAMDYKLPVIALSQLRRFGETRAPKLDDLKQSGSIEQDADMVIFVHRDKKPDSEFFGNETSAIVAKLRDGEQRAVKLLFIPRKTRFESVDSHHTEGGNAHG